jgi:hypothetical protein
LEHLPIRASDGVAIGWRKLLTDRHRDSSHHEKRLENADSSSAIGGSRKIYRSKLARGRSCSRLAGTSAAEGVPTGPSPAKGKLNFSISSRGAWSALTGTEWRDHRRRPLLGHAPPDGAWRGAQPIAERRGHVGVRGEAGCVSDVGEVEVAFDHQRPRHATLARVARYTKAAEQKTLAQSAMRRLSPPKDSQPAPKSLGTPPEALNDSKPLGDEWRSRRVSNPRPRV